MIRWERHDYRYHRRIDLHTEPVGWAGTLLATLIVVICLAVMLRGL